GSVCNGLAPRARFTLPSPCDTAAGLLMSTAGPLSRSGGHARLAGQFTTRPARAGPLQKRWQVTGTGRERMASPINKLALLVGGGPAPGINGVISSVTIEALNNGIQVFGIRDGFRHLVQSNREAFRPLTIENVRGVHFRGGSILGTARTNPTKD